MICVCCWQKEALKAANGRQTVFCGHECAGEFKRLNRDKPYGVGAEDWVLQGRQKAEILQTIQTALSGGITEARLARRELRQRWRVRALYNPETRQEVRL